MVKIAHTEPSFPTANLNKNSFLSVSLISIKRNVVCAQLQKKSETCNYLIWSDIVFDVQGKSLSLPVPQLFCSPVNALLSRCVNGVRGVIYSTCEKRYADLETSSQ